MPSPSNLPLSFNRDRAVRQRHGRLLSERPVVVQGVQGREVQIAIPDAIIPGGGMFWARYFIWQGRFYQVTFQSPSSTPYLEGRDAFILATSSADQFCLSLSKDETVDL